MTALCQQTPPAPRGRTTFTPLRSARRLRSLTLPARPAESDRAPKRVLFIAYLFPPVGGAGVQRTTKFVKYLPRCGWQPSVLTVANPSVPLYDDSLSADVPGGTPVVRARTWEPGYAVKAAVSAPGEGARAGRGLGRLLKNGLRRLANVLLQPDPQVLWLPAAVREGKRLLHEVPHEAIVATGPPFSSFLVGAALARHTGLPLVLDYRDEWNLSNAHSENKRPGLLSRLVQARLQRSAARAASALLATTRSSARALEAVREAAGSRARVTWIYNGYDPDDFPPTPSPGRAGGGSYRLAYVGTLWNLTSVAPVVEGVRELARRSPALASRLELVFAGRRTPAQQTLLDGLKGLPCGVVEHPYLDHHEALDLVRSADGLCVLLSDVPGAGRVVPAKIFEYLATGRPILAVAPRGELWDLLGGCSRGRLCVPSDTAGIADYLAQQIERTGASDTPPGDPWDAAGYARPSQARQLAELLDSLR